MNIELETLLKTILTQAEVKHIPLDDAKTIFLKKFIQSPGTLNYYEKNLRLLLSKLNDRNIYNTNQITTGILKEIATDYLKTVKPQTVNKYINSLLTMLRYLAYDLKLIDMPDVKYDNLIEDEVINKPLEQKDVISLSNYVLSKNIRTQLIINLLLSTGVRRSELTRIKLENVDLQHGTIYLQKLGTKARRGRYLFIVDDVKDLLIKYLEAYKPKYFLFEEDNHAMSPSSITSIVSRIKKELDLDDLTPHCLRRTFATYMLDNGANIVAVKELLGHSTLSQTQKYALATIKQQQRDCIAYNPLTLLKK